MVSQVSIESDLDYGDVAALYHQAEEIELIGIVDRCQQISFDLVVNHQPRFPILHHTRPGHIAEVRAMEGTLKRLDEEYRHHRTLLVMDRNLPSGANLQRV